MLVSGQAPRGICSHRFESRVLFGQEKEGFLGMTPKGMGGPHHSEEKMTSEPGALVSKSSVG
jgi:hypothetical protein